MNTEAIWHFLSTQGADFGLKVLGALAAWIIGRWLIGLVVRLLGTVLARGSKVDATLAEYLKSILTVLLNIVLVMADQLAQRRTQFEVFDVHHQSRGRGDERVAGLQRPRGFDRHAGVLVGRPDAHRNDARAARDLGAAQQQHQPLPQLRLIKNHGACSCPQVSRLAPAQRHRQLIHQQ